MENMQGARTKAMAGEHSKNVNRILANVQESPEYAEGELSFRMLEPIDACPYLVGDERAAWLAGYLDTRTLCRLGHVFDKFDVCWP
jgi:hypothetical protein